MNTSAFDPHLPQGWPDEEALARLANDIFSARPGGAPLQSDSISHDLAGDVPLSRPAPASIGLPGEAELKALLEAIPHFVTPEPQVPQPRFSAPFDVNAIRRDFPILEERVNGRQLIWLDNASTTQKPRVVIDRLKNFYEHENSNIHRAAHELAARATDAYELARDK